MTAGWVMMIMAVPGQSLDRARWARQFLHLLPAAAFVLMLLLPQAALAQSAFCRQLVGEADQIARSLRVTFPEGDVLAAGLPARVDWEFQPLDDYSREDSIFLTFVAVEGTTFRTRQGMGDGDLPFDFASEWQRFGFTLLQAVDEYSLWVTPPEGLARFGLSWAVVARHDDCAEEWVSPVGQAVFTIEEERWLPEAAACHLDTSAGDAAPAIAVSIDRANGERVRSGEPVGVSWQLDGRPDGRCANPLFLVLSLDSEVRFEGEGFVALPPGASGPYGMSIDKEKTRAVVPLWPLLEGAGDFRVIPHRAGPLNVTWHLVEVPQLVEKPTRMAHFARADHAVARLPNTDASLAVVPGEPRIVVQDRYAFDEPRRSVLSNSGDYLLQVFDRAYRVFDARTNDLIFERDGANPHFSPTSRFLVAFFEQGFVAEIVDLATAEVIYRGGTSSALMSSYVHEVGWSEGDAHAVLLVGGRHGGRFDVVSTLVDGRTISFWSDMANPENTAIIDFDQSIAYTSNSPFDAESLVLPLTTSGSDDDFFAAETGNADGYVNRIGEFDTRVFPAERLSLREMAATTEGPLRTNYVADVALDWDNDGVDDSPRLPDVVHRVLASGNAPVLALSEEGATLRGSSEAERAAFSLAKPAASSIRDRLLVRLSDMVDFESLDTDPGTVLTNEDIVIGEGGPFDGFMRHMVETSEEIAWIREDDIARAREEGRPEPTWDETARELSTSICPPQPDYIAPDGIDRLTHWVLGGRSVWVLRYGCEAGVGVPTNTGVLYLIRERADGYSVDVLDAGIENVDEWADEDEEGGYVYNESAAEALGLPNNAPVGAWLIDRRHIALSTPSRTIFVYDLVEDRTRLLIRDAPGGDNVASIHLSRDGRHLLQANANGSFHLHDSGSGGRVLNGYFLDDEITVYDDAGYFDATPEGAHFLHVRFPGSPGYHALDQFRSVLHRPQRLREVLSGADRPVAAPLIEIPPEVELVVRRPDGSSAMEIEISAGSAAGLSELRLVADGRTLWSQPVSGTSASAAPPVELAAGVRWLSAVATDANGLRSRPSTVAIPDAGAAATGKLFALGVGTDIYASPRIADLNFAAADARTFVAAVEAAAGRFYAEVETATLIDPEDIAGDLEAAIADLVERAGEGDTIMILVAGHGLRSDSGEFYLAGRNTRPDDIAGSAASWSGIASALRPTKARVMLFLDACHSGSLEAEATNDGAVEAFLDQGANIAVLSASKGRQFSFEQSQLRGGVFTTVLADLMRGERSEIDRNGNGIVELSEFYAALKQRVVAMTDGKQTPWIARNEMVGEIPLY